VTFDNETERRGGARRRANTRDRSLAQSLQIYETGGQKRYERTT
jgi:hypothetical protein